MFDRLIYILSIPFHLILYILVMVYILTVIFPVIEWIITGKIYTLNKMRSYNNAMRELGYESGYNG